MARICDRSAIKMTGKKLFRRLALVAMLALWLPIPRAAADPIADFYRGKTVTFVIGSGEAGLYDLGGRLMARYLTRFIPGNPTLVPQNMPGASSVRAASYIYSLGARDGTVFGTAQPTIILNKLLNPTATYEPEKYTWIGRLQPVTLVGVAWKGAPEHTMSDARDRKLIVGASGASGTSAIVPWALNRTAGTHFQVVTGYESLVPQLLAMERGELEGVGSGTLADILARQDWIQNDKVNFLYTISTQRSTKLPGVPTIIEFSENDLDRVVLRLLGSVTDVGFTIMAPPDVPADRAASLRTAFLRMMKDPGFLAEAAKIGLDPEPLSGEDLQKIVADTLGATGEALQRLRDVTRPPG
jgi:tripartite-type tricarboxylate transporter receptor subunit TctC